MKKILPTCIVGILVLSGLGAVALPSVEINAENDLTVEIKEGIGLGVNFLVTNTNETENITNIDWSISVKGGILGMVNKTVNCTIAKLEPGKNETVGTGLIFGLGGIDINATIGPKTVTAKGFVILFFVYISPFT